MDDTAFHAAVVLDPSGVVLGLATRAWLDRAAPDAPVREFMDEGVTTVRPSEDQSALSERMRQADVDLVVVTTSAGGLVGVFEHPGD